MQMSSNKYDFCVRWEPFLLRPNIPSEGVAKAPETPNNPRYNKILFSLNLSHTPLIVSRRHKVD